MPTPSLASVLKTLIDEIVLGAPDPSTRTYMLNRGDPGLLASLDRISATAASNTPTGGPSIAAHVDHLRYGLSLLNRWAAGNPVPSAEVDWTTSWKKNLVSDTEWRALRDELRHEATTWSGALTTPRELNDVEAGWMAGSITHLAYHFGAIRQVDRASRGPTAEDEARAEAAIRVANAL